MTTTKTYPKKYYSDKKKKKKPTDKANSINLTDPEIESPC